MLRERVLLLFFLMAEGALYLAFLLCDLAGRPGPGVGLKYAALLLCLLFSLAGLGERDGRLVSLALGFTALADLFLLVLNRDYLLGVGCFCAVQLLYALRLFLACGEAPPLLPLRLPLALAALAGLLRLGLLEPLTALAALYFTQLLCSAGECFLLPPSRGRRLFSAGLALFLCGDVYVGLSNLGAYVPGAAGALLSFARFGMWLFYPPSQVLIALSAERGPRP